MSGRWGCRPLGGTEVKDAETRERGRRLPGRVLFLCSALRPESTVILPEESSSVDRPHGLILSVRKYCA